jgi:hypothetical protein
LSIPSNFKGDLNSRLLIFKLKVQAEDDLSESQREGLFLADREIMLGEMLSRLGAIIRDDERQLDKVFRSDFRAKNFAKFIWHQMGLYDQEVDIMNKLNLFRQEQKAQSVEDCAIEPLLDLLVGDREVRTKFGQRRAHNGLWKLLSEIHQDKVAKGTGSRFYWQDARGLRSWLDGRKGALAKRWGLVHEKVGTAGGAYWFLRPTKEQVATAQEGLESAGFTLSESGVDDPEIDEVETI